MILPEGLWEAAQAEYGKRSMNRGTPYRSDASNLFTKLTECICCGGTVSLRSGKG